VAHVVAEGIGSNELTLPRGAVCDRCNHYIGHELETVLVAHPVISLAIQTFHLKGKGGRRRKRVGNVDRTVHKAAITIPCEEPVFTVVNGVRSATLRPQVDTSFDFLRFRRALHHIALNLVAYQDGPERALDSSFDAIRKYVREPKKGESWPFVQKIWPLLDTDREVKLGLNVIEGREVAGIKILCCAFFVALTDLSVLRTVVNQQESLGLDYVDSQYRPAKPPRPGMKRYRMTIYVDE
jgi:hypothetical protein